MELPHLTTVAGFFDGDGSVYFNVQLGGYCLHMDFTQCDYTILLLYRDLFGGLLTKRTIAEDAKKRTQYQLRLQGWDAYDALAKLRPHLRIKAHAADLAMVFMEEYYRVPDSAEKRQHVEALMKENRADVRTPLLPRPMCTIEYIAGLFDAEGCCRTDSISIAQKQDPSVLQEVREYFNFGRVYQNIWKTGARADKIAALQAMLPYLVVKREQAALALRFLVDGDTSVVPRISALKHVNFDLPDAELASLNAAKPDGRKAAARNDPAHPQRLVANEAARQRMSERGPVYNGRRTAEITSKAVASTYARGATRRKVTDEQIREVQRRAEVGDSGNAIAVSMGLHNAQVQKILNGTLLPLADLQAVTDPMALNAAARASALAARTAAADSSAAAVTHPRPRTRDGPQSDLTVALKVASRVLGGNNNRVLDDAGITLVRTALARGTASKQIAKDMGISAGVVAKVKRGALKTLDEAREAARAAGVYVDAVCCVHGMGADSTTTVEYADVWAAAAATGNKVWQILTWLDAEPSTGGVRWMRCSGEKGVA